MITCYLTTLILDLTRNENNLNLEALSSDRFNLLAITHKIYNYAIVECEVSLEIGLSLNLFAIFKLLTIKLNLYIP